MSGSETTINRLFPQPVKCRMIAARGYFPSKMVLIMVLSVKPVN